MKNTLLLVALMSSSAFIVSGCSTNAGTGAVIGSLVGAGIGKSTANHTDERAAMGAMLGGIVGAGIGSEKDRIQAQQATTAPTQTQARSSNTAKVVHVHNSGNSSYTHSHVGGDVQHAHKVPEYTDYYPRGTSIEIDYYYDNRGHRMPRHRRHHRR